MAAPTDSHWFARSWQTEDGLPNNNVNSLIQTPDGFLWVGTPRGLARFDGIHFDEIAMTNITGDASIGVLAMLPAKAGGLWLELDRGIVTHLNETNVQMTTPTNGLVDLAAHALVEGADGTLWLSYLGGAICSLKDSKATVIGPDQGLPFADISSVARDTKDRIWLSRAGRVGLFRAGKFELVSQVGSASTRVASARAGGIWICSATHLYRLDENIPLQEIGTFPADDARVQPSVVFEDSRGAVWVGTAYDGLFRFDGSHFEKVPTSQEEISSLLEDQEGNIWAGTHGGGLNRLRPSAIKLESVENNLPAEAVRSVCEDTNGMIWAVTENGLLVRHDADGWSTLSTNADWPGSTATCVASGPDGAVWIGTRIHRLSRWQNGQFTSWGKSRGIEAAPVSALMVSSNGDLWIGGNNRVLQFYRNDHFYNVTLPDDARAVRAIVQDKAGTIWVGTSKGSLLRMDGDKAVDETSKILGTPTSIRTLYASSDGSVWIGFSGNGLGRLKDGRFSRITTAQGLFDDYISQIVSDGRGSFWFGSDRGIFRINERELVAATENPAARVRPTHYGRGEGLPSLQADFGYVSGAIRSHDGRIWMPTRNALAVLDPEKFAVNPRPPQVLIKRVTVDKEDLFVYDSIAPASPAAAAQKTALLHLPPDHRKLQFDFTALCFSAPENVRLQYKLEGFDNDWLEADAERSASYPRLPSGTYRFRVRACNNDGVWNEAGAVFAFAVTPFAWQRWWFQPLVFLGFATITIVLVRYVSFRRLRSRLRLLEQQAALDKERARIARDLHDDLGSHLTRIVLLSDLMLDYRAQPEKSVETAERVSTTARQVIKSLDETVWAVNPRHDTLPHLVNYIGPYAVEFLRTAGIRCRPDLPLRVPDRSVSTDVRHNLFLVVKEALNNIVTHSGADEVRLEIAVDEDTIRITIADNGKGFDLPTVRSAPGNGIPDGLNNMRQRMEEIRGTFHLESKPGGGTRIVATAPLTRHE